MMAGMSDFQFAEALYQIRDRIEDDDPVVDPR